MPKGLEGCIGNYLYAFEKSRRMGLLNVDKNSIPLDRLNISTEECSDPVIQITPIIKLRDQVLTQFASSKVELCKPLISTVSFTLSKFLANPQDIDFEFILFLISINNYFSLLF